MTEKEKMINGYLYDADDAEVNNSRLRANRLCKRFNALYHEQIDERKAILNELLGSIGERSFLVGPIHFDHGTNTYIGNGSYANANLVILDCAPVRIGNDVFIANNVSLVTATHPLLASERKSFFDEKKGYCHDLEYAKPITIEDGVWLGANVVVGPGVRIGQNSVIGMGSVVTRDIPPNVVAYGNPCRVRRNLTEKDSIKYRKDLYGEGDK